MARQIAARPDMRHMPRLLNGTKPHLSRAFFRALPYTTQSRNLWGGGVFHPSSLVRGMFQLMEEDVRQMQRHVDRFRLRSDVEAETLSKSQIQQKEDGSKMIQLEFNVKDFKPEEILIKLDRLDNLLSVSAHHESLQEGQHVMRRFSKVFRLPSSIESTTMTSSIQDGILTIAAPLGEGNTSRIVDIPIEKIE